MEKYQECIAEDGKPDFELLFEKARPQLTSVALRIMRDPDEAEDIVQQSFAHALKNRDQYQGRAQASTWMYRITVNTALMSLRSKRRRPTSHIEDLAPTVREELAKDDPCDRPDRHSDRYRLFKRLVAAFDILSDVDRKIVTLRLYEGWSTAEVAEALNLSLSAIKTRLHRARTALQNELLSNACPSFMP